MHFENIQDKFVRIASHLDEKSKRLWCANEAMSLGWGGVTIVSKATGISRTTITAGIRELAGRKDVPSVGIRRKGGGRKKTVHDTDLRHNLEALVEPLTRGDPESPLRWVGKSTRKIAKELNLRGHRISHSSVASLLKEMDYRAYA